MEITPWRIAIDTGGTFTDCIALSPEGASIRFKVLSNSSLRGVLNKVIDANTIKVNLNLTGKPGLLDGYTFELLGTGRKALIKRSDIKNGVLELATSIVKNLNGNTHFEITAYEEVPILAARLITGTELSSALPPLEMRLGSTKGTNALLERKGAKTVLLTTKGMEDIVEIGTQQRSKLFALNIQKPKPLYHSVLGVDERLNADGSVLKALSGTVLDNIVKQVKLQCPDAVAIALMHSYLNDRHEQLLADRLRDEGITTVSLSSSLSPSIKILPRTETSLANAYLSPIINSYLDNISKHLIGNQLNIMTSSGGLVGSSDFNPKDSLLSGPAGGVVGAVGIAKGIGKTKVLTFDMGGTSTDVSHYNGSYDYRYVSKVGDTTIVSPSIYIETIAAGGGSVCSYDGYKLTVGPESAGASPGPACYGKGGPLTITDVNLLLGRIDSRNFGIPIDEKASESALKSLQQRVKGKYSDEELLFSFLEIANERMAEAIKKISVKNGYDPKEYTLVSFGGAGSQHCCAVASLLDVKSILIPYDAGILSAYGIGVADIERFAQLQILDTLDRAWPTLEEKIKSLENKALSKLHKQKEAGYAASVSDVFLYLRFLGQEDTIEMAFSEIAGIKDAFKDKYKQRYGHWIDNQVIEVESIKVIAKASIGDSIGRLVTEPTGPANPQNVISGFFNGEWKSIPIFRWEDTPFETVLKGPALVVSRNTVVTLEEGWEGSLDKQNNLNLVAGKNMKRWDDRRGPDEAELELFTNRFVAIAEEMGALLQRTSFSVNIKERLDFSCALLDRHGELIVNAPHIPVHLGSLGVCVRRLLEVIEMGKDDVIITNHPRFGGSHLPDITLVSAVFTDESELVGYVANRGHHAEIGGIKPGSMPAGAKNLEEEGVVIPPMYLIKGGVPRWEEISRVLSQAKYPSRSVQENLADLNGALASIAAGKSALLRLCSKFNPSLVGSFMNKLKLYAASCVAKKVAMLGSKAFKAEERLDDGTVLSVNIQLNGKGMSISFEGTSDVHKGNMNATEAITNSVVLYVLRLLIDEDIPLNEGLLKEVQLDVPLGSLLNPKFVDDNQYNPAVVGGNTEVSQRLTDTLIKALGLAACSQGTMNNLLFGNDFFGYYETICGGVGAGNGFGGARGVHQHMTNTKITDPEIMELKYPVRLARFSIRDGSGGNGKWSGGDGVIREVVFKEPVDLTILSQHRKEQPYGAEGAEPGAVGKQWIVKADNTKIEIPGIGGYSMEKNDRVIIHTPGGGGYGKA